MTREVVYALDIGVYNLNAAGHVLASTTTAWACVSESVPTLALSYTGSCAMGAFRDSDGRTWPCGRSLDVLARAIVRDVEAGHRVALGFEAPMWFPTRHAARPGLTTFAARFETERGSEWYLQSGAAATLKAIGLGIMLFSAIVAQRDKQRFSTRSNDLDGAILLYEAFVAGDYKIAPPASVARSGTNEWDALTAAIAWRTLHSDSGLAAPPPLRAVELHKGGSLRGGAISVWSIIAAHLATPAVIEGPVDCQVVGLRAL
jgi:hypothetical protein